MQQTQAINRIVIGDVGSGKTIVGFIIAIAYLVSKSRGQAAIMAPTEILARQHHAGLTEYLSSLDIDINVILLAGKDKIVNGVKLTPKKFDQALAELDMEQGMTIWVGTHALLYDERIVPTLVLVDEQHRFGVRQRHQLASEAHYVSFSATPIPRTLALALYQDLQPLFLDRIEGRQDVATSIASIDDFDIKILPTIKKHIEKGKKVYVVCAKVEEGEDDTVWTVNKTKKLLEEKLGDIVLATHGREKDKDKTIVKFRDDETHSVLVATTVIEVGVDVSEATLMVILNAEKFGLAALHQIRGRVGRNDYDYNQCILVSPREFMRSKRLGYMLEYNDGFQLAEKDLELRGSGQVHGKSQSGFGQIDELIGLDPDMYKKIVDEVSQLDFQDSKIERLKNYVEKEVEKVREE